MANDQTILEHYKNVALQFGLTPQSSMQDQVIRDTETNFFVQTIEEIANGKKLKILDVGCGNAFTLSKLSKYHQCIGLEFSKDLYQLAKSRDLLKVFHGDMRLPLSEQINGETQFDIVISQRSIINLLGKDQQVNALKNIAAVLAPNGHYILSESFYETHTLLNHARAEFNLEAITPSKHNLFLTESRLQTLHKSNVFEKETLTKTRHTLSTHFYLTRVLHPHLRGQEGKMKAPHFLNFFTESLGTGLGTYSPIQFRVFQKN